MARREHKTWFFYQREQYGSGWIDRQKPDELIKNCERVLSDIAYGNFGDMNSDNFRDLCHPGMINALMSFCRKRMSTFTVINTAIENYRNYLVQNNSADANTEFYTVYNNIYNCMYCYRLAYDFLTAYANSNDLTYIINFCNLIQDYRNWISPNKFM